MTGKKTIALVFRLILAAVFLFSGFTKLVDPWGFALKIREYLSVFGLEGPDPLVLGLSVVLSAAEMTFGLALLFGVKRRLVALGALLFMTGFTALTLWSALTDPVADCGCFGDALKLSNWQTFYKNLILWPMSLVVWLAAHASRRRRPRSAHARYDTVNPSQIYVRNLEGYHSGHKPSRRAASAGGWIVLVLFFVASCGVGVYALRNLPLIDFLPFRVGVNIPQAMGSAGGGESETTLIYRDLTDGTQHEFALSDTTWHDDTRWEYVDTRVVERVPAAMPTISEFAVFNAEEDITDRILHDPGRVYLLVVTDPGAIPAPCRSPLHRVVKEARAVGSAVYAVTPAPLTGHTALRLGDSEPVPLFNIDATTLKMMLRARTGLVVLQGGTIIDKQNCRSLR